jgi:WD40 repeat protein
VEGEPTCELEFWDLGTGQRLRGFTPRPGSGGPWASWDGRTLVSVSAYKSFPHTRPAGYDGSVRWWDPKTGRPRGRAWQPRRPAWVSQLSEDGSTLAGWCLDERLRLYDLATGLQRGGDVRATMHRSDARIFWYLNFALTSDGGTVLTSDSERTVCLWDTRHLRAQASLAANPRRASSRAAGRDSSPRAAFSPDGRTVLICSSPELSWGRLTDVGGSIPLGRPLSHRHLFHPVFSPDGKSVVTLTHNHTFGGDPVARVWDAATGEPRTPPLLNPKYLHTAAFGPDGRTLAFGGPGGAWLWDVATGKLRQGLVEKTAASRLAFSPDGHYLAAGCRGGWAGVGAGIRVWDVQSGTPRGDFVKAGGDVELLAFVDGGRTLLAFAPVGELHVIETATGRPRREPFRLSARLGAAVFSRDGARLATADASNVVSQWDTATGRPCGSRMAQPGRVVSLHYSPDGLSLAVLCEDETLRLWDVRAGLPLGPPLVHASQVLAVAFSPDGSAVLTATEMGRAHTWPLPVPVADNRQRLALWLRVMSGTRPGDGEIEPLDVAAWRYEREQLAQRWPDPDPALALPGDGAWHAARAGDAEDGGNTTAALRHLDRLIALGPPDWSSYARKGRAFSEAGALDRAAEAYDRAEALDLRRTRDWYRQQAAMLRALDRQEAALWYDTRLARAGDDD